MPWSAVTPAPTSGNTAPQDNTAAPAAATVEPPPAHPSNPASEPHPNAAVQRCCDVYYQTFAARRAAGDKNAEDKANAAFKNALPYLTSRAGIRDFIACVAQGMVLRVFWHDEGPKLIVAAKAALAAVPNQPRPAGRPKSSEPPQ
jgi:hypothetical protein